MPMTVKKKLKINTSNERAMETEIEMNEINKCEDKKEEMIFEDITKQKSNTITNEYVKSTLQSDNDCSKQDTTKKEVNQYKECISKQDNTEAYSNQDTAEMYNKQHIECITKQAATNECKNIANQEVKQGMREYSNIESSNIIDRSKHITEIHYDKKIVEGFKTSDTTDNSRETNKFFDNNFIVKQAPIIKFNKIYKKLYFSKLFYKLSEIYSAILTVQRFNEQKNLRSIFVKCKKSIEEMIKDNFYMKDLEQINYFVQGEFKKISIEHESKLTETFTFKFPDLDYNYIFWCFICEKYEDFLKQNGKKHIGNKFMKGFAAKEISFVPRKRLFTKSDLYKSAESAIKERERNKDREICNKEYEGSSKKEYEASSAMQCDNLQLLDKGYTRRTDNSIESDTKHCIDYSIESDKHCIEHSIESDAKHCIDNSIKNISVHCIDKPFEGDTKHCKVLTAKEKASKILQRIKEKEQKRKSEFVKMCKENDEILSLKNKIDSFFVLENKNKILVEKITKILNIFNGKKSIEKLCERFENYRLCFVNEELHLEKM